MSKGEEKRRSPRIDAKVPLRIVPSEGAAHNPQSAESLNLSERGLYFELPGGVQAGSRVDISFVMPAEVTGGMPMKVRCTALVVRVDVRPPGNRVGVAAHIERFESVVGEG